MGCSTWSILQIRKLRVQKLPASELVWDDLKHFALVAREGSIAGAARFAKVEHSTIVRRIGRLEETLKLRLFNRLVRGWVLTEEGNALRERVLQIEGQVLGVVRSAQDMGKEAGSVTLTAPPDLLSDVVIPALAGFAADHPQIELRLFGATDRANLSRGEADIALRMVKVEGAELVSQRVCSVSYGLYGLAGWSGEVWHKRRFVGYSDLHQPFLNDALIRLAAGREIALQTNSPRVALKAAAAGLGLALLPNFLAESCGELVVVETHEAPVSRPVYLVMQRDVRKAHRVRAVVDHLRQHICREI
ncbi:LysR family transcriptional regulator [Hydrogenophaga sp.]|uniref:LysR family transcriptional regulator n=1 Tax=Hydrogenophaga sp. TaxID=1904254 RepID=UPI0025C694E5|nr:LysR family transcriptional regulator [Hydrogenophaga sp.]